MSATIDGVACFGRELHVFCDSSSFAYGAVAYVVTENETGERKAQLLMAKSRIAPTKSITIPKLELCATVLGARLIKKIQESLSFNECFSWTDSTIVLGQIRSKRVKFNVFTAHRISEIHKLTDSSKWQRVPGGSNPADIVSRGKAEDWPEDPYGVMFIASNIANESQVLPPHPLETILNKSNSYVKVKNILAYVLRFLTKSTRRVKGPLTPTEIHASEHKLISFAQSQHLSEVRSAIADGSMWTGRKFNNVRHLTPFIDEQGIIRVGGRLAKSLQDYDVRHPMLLPKCRLSTLITMQAHKDNMHAGPQLLLATLRQRYWPLGGRNLTRRVTRSCVVCWKKRPLMLERRMGDLPQGRIEHVVPFKVCGVDLCGPVLTRPSFKRGGVSYKTYICVFVCFTTKAVHLEVVGSLTTDSFIAALRRFVARRSAPSDIFSDNATNFKGTYKRAIQRLSKLPVEMIPSLRRDVLFLFAAPRGSVDVLATCRRGGGALHSSTPHTSLRYAGSDGSTSSRGGEKTGVNPLPDDDAAGEKEMALWQAKKGSPVPPKAARKRWQARSSP
ncbi:uncharacterized protein LOC129808863 [Phlebotomus papatasi]|uniref:uncharacterized protein LOC129808863 n=1 Tax=Phlebotomus papatasi TaxID=29031 RepID=UPI00248423F6|nr:uncharacterized protein LOC129808863 [Phlebotomus papatasi]